MLPFHFSPLHYPIQSLCSVFDSFLKWCCNPQCISKLNPFMLHNHEHQVSPVTLMKSFLYRGVYSKLNYNLIELFLGTNMVKMAIYRPLFLFAVTQILLILPLVHLSCHFLYSFPVVVTNNPYILSFITSPVSSIFLYSVLYLFSLPSSLAASLSTLVCYQRHVEVETPLYSCLVLSHLLCL